MNGCWESSTIYVVPKCHDSTVAAAAGSACRISPGIACINFVFNGLLNWKYWLILSPLKDSEKVVSSIKVNRGCWH